MARRGIGYAFIGLGAFMGLAVLSNLGAGYAPSAYVIALLFGAALPVGVGVALARSTSSARLRRESAQAWDSELLRLAERRGGHLTVAEVVAHADLSKEQAEQRLERFCVEGVAEHRIAEGGTLVYRFEGFLSEAEKRRAQGLLDD